MCVSSKLWDLKEDFSCVLITSHKYPWIENLSQFHSVPLNVLCRIPEELSSFFFLFRYFPYLHFNFYSFSHFTSENLLSYPPPPAG